MLDHFALPKRPTSCLYTHHPLSLDYLSLLLACKLKAHLTCCFFPGTHSRELLLLSSQPSVHGSSTGGRGEFSLLRVYSSAFPWHWHRRGLAFFSALAQGCPSSKELHMSWALPRSQFTMGHLSFQRPEVVQALIAPIRGPFWYQHLCWADGFYLLFHLLSPPCPTCCVHGPAFLRLTGFSQLHWQMFPLKGSQCLGYFLH